MTRFFTKRFSVNSEKEKLNRLKRQCKKVIKTLLQLHAEHQTTHCVLVMGQPESGKSILCASSGELLYATHTDFIFEIYVQHNTLFFHIPHDFFLLSDVRHQRLAWHFLATQLKKQRAYLPLTRCLIHIDLQDFLTRSKVSNDTRLSQIAFALNTIANGLNTPLDVAVFFTKIDLIPGFNEFFNHESAEFLAQPWGISLEKSTSDALASECEPLIKKLNERLLWCLHHEINPEDLYLIKTFPLAMETIQQKLVDILPGFLAQWNSNRFLKPTTLYFVSCRQFRELTETTQAESSAIKKINHINQHKYFFTQRALESQCQYVASHTTTYIEKITQLSFVALCTLTLLAFIFYTSQQFSQHIALIQSANQTLAAGQAFSKRTYPSLKLNAVTHELEKISATWQNLEKDQQSLLVEKIIFTRNNQLETQLQQLYQRIISQQWLPLVNQQLENYVTAHLSSDPANAYIAFTIYLMLSQPDWPIDTQYIDTHLTDLLGSSNDPMTLLPGNIQKNLLVIDENSPFIQSSREAFLALPAEKLAYILLFSTLNTHHSLDVSTVLSSEPRSLEIEKKFAFIPEIYTAPLFSEIYKKRLLSVAKEAINGNKILGTYQRKNISEDTLLPKLREEYLQLYAETWEEAIKHIRVTQMQTFADFSAQLKALTSVSSPILALLNLSHTNTLIPEVEQASPFLTTFNDTLTPESTPENSALYHSFAFLIKLNDQVLRIQHSGDQVATACALVAEEAAASNENPTDAQQIRYLASQLPEPIQTWWLQIVDTYYALLKQSAVGCQ